MYKVISIACSGLGGKVHRNGATVTDADFPQGRALELVNQGHLKTTKNEDELSEETGKNSEEKTNKTKKK